VPTAKETKAAIIGPPTFFDNRKFIVAWIGSMAPEINAMIISRNLGCIKLFFENKKRIVISQSFTK